MKVVRQGRESTGLARPDYFDWTAQLRVDVQRFRPDIIVAMLGGNDFQDLVVPGRPSVRRFWVDQWNALYRQRVSRPDGAGDLGRRPARVGRAAALEVAGAARLRACSG